MTHRLRCRIKCTFTDWLTDRYRHTCIHSQTDKNRKGRRSQGHTKACTHINTYTGRHKQEKTQTSKHTNKTRQPDSRVREFSPKRTKQPLALNIYTFNNIINYFHFINERPVIGDMKGFTLTFNLMMNIVAVNIIIRANMII